MPQEDITETELNSEVELLNSRDLLRKVVIANGLQTKNAHGCASFGKRKRRGRNRKGRAYTRLNS